MTRYYRPERDPEKLFCFLYPTELLALLRGTNDNGKTVVPLGRRVLYAVATDTEYLATTARSSWCTPK